MEWIDGQSPLNLRSSNIELPSYYQNETNSNVHHPISRPLGVFADERDGG